MSYDFISIAHGKWILAGEYSVIKGGAALVFPLLTKNMTLQYTHTDTPLTATFHGNHLEHADQLFWQALTPALQQFNYSNHDLTGKFTLHNEIPIGAGLGSSAALCINIVRWLIWKQWLPTAELFSMARQLENLFHGKSSGLDIAAAMHQHGIYFKQQQLSPITQTWQPHWYLSSTGKIGITSQSVHKVTLLSQQDPALIQHLDQQMQHCVALAVTALQDSSPQRLSLLATAINQACDCFVKWGLADGVVAQHIATLFNAGAIAAKPTGSGDGGYVLSLWDTIPSPEMQQELIKLDALPNQDLRSADEIIGYDKDGLPG